MSYVPLHQKGKGANMRYVKKIDEKGRVAIPFNIRKSMSLKEGDAFRVIQGKGRGISLVPHNEGVKANMVFDDIKTLKNIVDVLTDHNVSMIESEISSHGEEKHLAARLDLNGFDSHDLEKELRSIKKVRDISISLMA